MMIMMTYGNMDLGFPDLRPAEYKTYDKDSTGRNKTNDLHGMTTME